MMPDTRQILGKTNVSGRTRQSGFSLGYPVCVNEWVSVVCVCVCVQAVCIEYSQYDMTANRHVNTYVEDGVHVQP